ncbi:plasmid partitioning protein RepB [Cohaesibacter celericrescens]|uniref:Plasmid partitioning protein RepB n=1 Tax=Cohaesibacter celericrescens TaxID=2067669 RepID=A0A2N5XNG1_9HYPH|nr:plasmid partitioning protein RepB [Cohaesibacter celericrescens]PLW76043.1 plasmid partitioning protein RepB [Cohaesibacter celericrescens]
MKKSILSRMADRADVSKDADNSMPQAVSLRNKRASSPVIANVGKALSQLSEDSIVSLDPTKIDRSPFKDRFDSDPEFENAIEELKVSIQQEGQKIPVLVRPHPAYSDRYQLAYGFRRLEAIKRLMEEAGSSQTIKIRAHIRQLTDRELIQEQSLENGVRENLSWIEQAMWALQLRNADFNNRAICPVMGLTEPAVSMLFKVTASIPHEIIHSIGRAPGVGRPKWLKLAELLKDRTSVDNVKKLIQTEKFELADSSMRVTLALEAASNMQRHVKEKTQSAIEFDGRVIGQIKEASNGTTMLISKNEKLFANWLVERLPELLTEFEAKKESQS